MKLELFLYFLFFDNDLRVYNHYYNDKVYQLLQGAKGCNLQIQGDWCMLNMVEDFPIPALGKCK